MPRAWRSGNLVEDAVMEYAVAMRHLAGLGEAGSTPVQEAYLRGYEEMMAHLVTWHLTPETLERNRQDAVRYMGELRGKKEDMGFYVKGAEDAFLRVFGEDSPDEDNYFDVLCAELARKAREAGEGPPEMLR